MIVLAILPALFFAALVIAFAGRDGIRQAFLYAAVGYTLTLAAATELLSLGGLLRPGPVAGFWAAAALLAGLYVWRYTDRRAALAAFRGAGAQFSGARLELLGAAAVLAVVLLVALVAPPNDPNSMGYHLPRVAQWAQQGSIGPFPASYLAQLFHPPLAEWNILQLQILSGGDRFANLPQWFALAGCGLTASLLARELQQRLAVQALAAVIAVTLPVGILLGSNSANDLVVSFWLLAFVLFALQYLRESDGERTAERLLLCGLALGFVLLTKGTGYVYAVPAAGLLLLYGLACRRGWRPRIRLGMAAAAIVAVALLLNAGHYARNYALFGDPLRPADVAYSHLNEPVNLAALGSNLVRNSALHWALPGAAANDATLEAVRRVFGETIDAVPGATLGLSLFESRLIFWMTGTKAGNFVHFWLLAAAVLAALAFRRRWQFNPLTALLAGAVLLGAISFSAALQFEQFNARYHTPLFMLGAPVAAVFVSTLAARIPRWPLSRPRPPAGIGRTTIVAGALLLLAIPWLLFNSWRPLISLDGPAFSRPYESIPYRYYPSILAAPRSEMYFNSHPEAIPAYRAAVNYIAANHPEAVGLHIAEGQYEYPIWALFREQAAAMPRLGQIGMDNVSRQLLEPGFAPPYILSTRGATHLPEFPDYRVVLETADVGVWEPLIITVLASPEAARQTADGGAIDAVIDEILGGSRLAAQADFAIYADGRRLIYYNESCDGDDAAATFFLHLIPEDASDLPVWRREHGFDNLDFHLDDYAWRSGARCLTARRLPDYPISRLRTGQYVPETGEVVWQTEFVLPE